MILVRLPGFPCLLIVEPLTGAVLIVFIINLEMAVVGLQIAVTVIRQVVLVRLGFGYILWCVGRRMVPVGLKMSIKTGLSFQVKVLTQAVLGL